MPVVVVSGYVSEAFQAPEPLADLYLEKPINPEELVTIVNELLKIGDRLHEERELRAESSWRRGNALKPKQSDQAAVEQAIRE